MSAVAPPSASGARAAYREIARALESHGAQTFQERAFAPVELRDEVRAARQEALASSGADPSVPWLALAHEGALSIQLWAVAFDDPSARSIVTVEAGDARGRLRTGSTEMLWLPGLRGDRGRPVTVQAEQMFARAEHALAQRDLSFEHVVRTWIYARRLLDWYGELNRARTSFYAARGIGVARPFPASTGIQGRSDDEECLMDVLATRSGARAILDGSGRQCAAVAYGSSFSRGACIDADGAPLILVSGTASIGPDGRTLHAGAPELQAIETLLAVAALLETRGATLRDLVRGIVFHANDAALAGYERACSLLCLPDLPLVPVRADVCRRELAIEVEGIAAGAGS